jgi:histidinol phosphatase-like enzyme
MFKNIPKMSTIQQSRGITSTFSFFFFFLPQQEIQEGKSIMVKDKEVKAVLLDVDGSKPDEDLVVVGLRKAGLEGHPESAIMVGDTPYDVVSADKVGVRTVAVRCGGWDMKDFEEARKTIDVLQGSDTTPEELFDDPADLLARFHTSLLAK